MPMNNHFCKKQNLSAILVCPPSSLNIHLAIVFGSPQVILEELMLNKYIPSIINVYPILFIIMLSPPPPILPDGLRSTMCYCIARPNYLLFMARSSHDRSPLYYYNNFVRYAVRTFYVLYDMFYYSPYNYVHLSEHL